MRLRVVFEDRHLLTRAQKSEGLKRSWILLKPELETISDVISHLTHSFDLHHSCPNGLRISMDGFVLPPFESVRVFKDKDIIRVKKKDGAATHTDQENPLEVIEVEKRPLLALEEFDKETGGYQSDPEDADCDGPDNTLRLESSSCGKAISKKRKSSQKLHSSKRKRIKSAFPENSPEVPTKGLAKDVRSEDQLGCNNGVPSQKSLLKDSSKASIKNTSDVDVCNRAKNSIKHMSTKTRCDNLHKNEDKSTENFVTEGTKKGPSRSARRKKAKRQWLRELLNSQKIEQTQSVPDQAVCDKSQASEERTDTEAEIVPIVVRPGHIRFEPLGKDQVIQKSQGPMENFQWNGITSKRKGQKWGMEKGSVSRSNEYEDFRKGSFETDHNKWNEMPDTRKRKKGAMENTSTSKIKDAEESREGSIRKLNVEEMELVYDSVDFEKLNRLTCSPKEGDVVAYRLVELSSTWCPELSSFRVGKVAWFDSMSNMVMLVPVPGCPVVSDKKSDEEAAAQESDASLYFEDGSLEIDFSSLVDVLIVKGNNSDPGTAASDGSKEATVNNKEVVSCVSNKEAISCVSDRETVSCVAPNDKREETAVRTPENGVDTWEQISQVLSERKTQLLKETEERWTQKESSGKRPLSYRGLRSGALGPTMALLRAGNGL